MSAIAESAQYVFPWNTNSRSSPVVLFKPAIKWELNSYREKTCAGKAAGRYRSPAGSESGESRARIRKEAGGFVTPVNDPAGDFEKCAFSSAG